MTSKTTDFRGPRFGVEPAEINTTTQEQLYASAIYGVKLNGEPSLGERRLSYGEAFIEASSRSKIYGKSWHRDDKHPDNGWVVEGQPIYFP